MAKKYGTPKRLLKRWKRKPKTGNAQTGMGKIMFGTGHFFDVRNIAPRTDRAKPVQPSRIETMLSKFFDKMKLGGTT